MYISDQANYYHCINKITVANEDLVDEIKKIKPKWTNHSIKKISISVDADTRIKINNSEILIKKDYGFENDYSDPDITSLKTLDSGVNIYAILTY